MQNSISMTMLVVSVMSLVTFIVVVLPRTAVAMNAAESANAMCNPVIPPCGCQQILDPITGQCTGGANMNQCPCQATVSGITFSGICIAPKKCETKSAGGGGVDSMLSQLGQMLSQAMQALQGGGGGGGGGGQQPQMPPMGGMGGTGMGGSQGCTSYYQVSTPSSDPCAYYVPSSIGSDLNGALGSTAGNDLLNALNGGTNTNIPSIPGTGTGINNNNTNGTVNPPQNPNNSGSGGINNGTGPQIGTTQGKTSAPNSIIGLISNPNNLRIASTTETVIVNPDGTTSTTTTYSFFGLEITLPSNKTSAGDLTAFMTIANIISGKGASSQGGDLFLGGNGATIYSSNFDSKTNTAISGFIGANSSGGSVGLAAWLCRTRPWANNIISRIIPSSFFDSLCTRRGYAVGAQPVRTVTPGLTQTRLPAVKKTATPVKNTTTTATSTVPTIPPRVQVWAVPATVSIGSRTSIFWSARGVENCLVTSPDGSFRQTTLSGGASTVPLTTSTTYTISCLTPDGTPVTDYFTVRMAI